MSKTTQLPVNESKEAQLRNIALALSLVSILAVLGGLFSAILGLDYATSTVQVTRFQNQAQDLLQPLVYFNMYAGTLLVIIAIGLGLAGKAKKNRSLSIVSICISGFVFLVAALCWTVGLLGLPR